MSVTIIIPNWNCEAYVADAIASVCNDPTVSEIIVVDNGSSDGSLALLEGLCIPTLKILKNKGNVGAARARDQAIDVAGNQYVCFLDADDMLSPCAVSNAYAQLIATRTDLVALHMMKLMPDGSRYEVVPILDEIITGQEAFRRTVGGWSVHAMGVLCIDTYRAARRAFHFHGYSDDELLTRHILTACRSITGVADEYIYRFVAKPRTFARSRGQIRTDVAVLAMAHASTHTVPDDRLRQSRNSIVKGIAGLLRWPAQLLADHDTVRRDIAAIREIAVPWRQADAPYGALFVILLIVFGLMPPKMR